MSALEKIMELAPKAVEEAERILNRSTSMNARIQMIEIVLNRAFGKPEAALRIETGGGRLRNRGIGRGTAGGDPGGDGGKSSAKRVARTRMSNENEPKRTVPLGPSP